MYIYISRCNGIEINLHQCFISASNTYRFSLFWGDGTIVLLTTVIFVVIHIPPLTEHNYTVFKD